MTQQTHTRVHTVAHEVNRLTIGVSAPFQEFRERYERAVPAIDAGRFERLVRDNADWGTVLRATAENAPHDFLIYWRFEAMPLMGLAGDRWLCVEYLMGNHTIAQRMFHHDPAVLLYAPLRTAIYEDPEGTTCFTVDQPSTRFSSFGDPDITQVGLELDRKLAALLEHLDAPVPAELVQGRASHG
ncbi:MULTISPECIES: DUF302 domain-containing protein [unclassified Streptosporangium]|uniref:DUF302 domain-containing protein n=1 Tax=unclassified Streptosporangium TaxID=2632669 RepID=UPI002E2C27A9|nr:MULTISPECIES: DUF302 domain-containing protein [unclassified Streptosporangium]